MKALELKRKLESIIESKLLPLIDNDYILWDLPYHINIGDILIWEGELDFLAKTSYKMLDYGSSATVSFPEIDSNTIILLHGGGNFGDIYRSSQVFRNKVIENYPNNKIIVLPQTVYYSDKEILEKDMDIFSRHKNLFVCTRDRKSYQILSNYLNKNSILHLPDMAFCIEEKKLNKMQTKAGCGTLYMERKDGEIGPVNMNLNYDKKYDWPTFENTNIEDFVFKVILKVNKELNYNNYKFAKYVNQISNKLMNNYFRERYFNLGVGFIGEYEKIITTRLHGCILGVLLGKEVILLDNNYGKNSNFYLDWLSEYEKIKLVK